MASLKESSKKVRRALDEEEKATRNLRWELEDRRQMAAAEVRCACGMRSSMTPLIMTFEAGSTSASRCMHRLE